jgi:hypothetical protein
VKLNWICVALVLFVSPICAAQQTSGISSGACSPNIQANKEKVVFTCTTTTPIEAETVKKINVLLSEIVKKQKTDAQSTNKRLDDIIDLWASTQSDIHSMAQSLAEGSAQSYGDAHALGKKIVEQAVLLEAAYKDLTTFIEKLGGQTNAREQANVASVRFYWDFRDCCRTYVIEMHDEAIHKLGSAVTTSTGEGAFNEIKSMEQNGAIDYRLVPVKIMYFGMFIPYFKHLGLLLQQTPETH